MPDNSAIPLLAIGILSLALILGGLIILALSLRWFLASGISVRLQTYVAEEDIRPRREVSVTRLSRSQELSGSLIYRTVVPLFRRMGLILGRLTPASSIENLRRQLYIAGHPLGLGAREFFGLRVAFVLVGLSLSYLLLQAGVDRRSLVVSVSILLICFLFPVLWLRMMVRSRQEKIRRGLPDALDMLSVCADAGLGFDQSLLRVSEHWSTPIGVELGRVVAEMEMGLSRREALRNLADRYDIPELSSFVSVIIQSEQLGMSIADTLHAQADQMRIERHFRAQEIARTLPVKMLIPLVFLIFPALIAVILGPAVPQILELFKGF
jgi:tight adherence protein C